MPLITNTTSLSAGSGPPSYQLRCPHCLHMGVFGPAPVPDLMAKASDGPNRTRHYRLGHRICPNPSCQGHVFVIAEGGERVVTYPRERVALDVTGVPPEVRVALDEAVACHAIGCYRAAAVMTRRAVELLCDHEGAEGANLQQRLQALGNKMLMPAALFGALDALRLLGNDAVHVELKTFDNIGHKEVDVALAVVQEVLKAVYQHQSLVARLTALKKP